MAGVFSGALSTVSGGLNSLAAVTLEDFVKVYYRNELTEQKATRLSKLLALFYGIFSYGLVFMVKNIPGLVQAWLGIFGVLGGPVLGLFSIGMFIPFANSTGALSGGIVSVVFMLWVSIGGNFSRLSGQTIYETKSLSIDDCPSAWNITEEVTKEPMPGKKRNSEFTNSKCCKRAREPFKTLFNGVLFLIYYFKKHSKPCFYILKTFCSTLDSRIG